MHALRWSYTAASKMFSLLSFQGLAFNSNKEIFSPVKLHLTSVLAHLEGVSIAFKKLLNHLAVQFSSVQSLSHVQLFVTPWTAGCQASLAITNSWNLPKLMSIELVMPSSYLILCCPLLLLPSIFPSQWAGSLHQVAKVLELQHQSFQWIFRVNFLVINCFHQCSSWWLL